MVAKKLVTLDMPSEQPCWRSEQCPNEDNAGLQEKPYTEREALHGNWVGSPEWAAARTTRKKRLLEIFQTSLITGIPIRKPIKPIADEEPPPAPSAPPPKLEILLPCVGSEDKDTIGKVSEANAAVFEQLQNTASDDIEVRKRMFKSLCARWHPDKNSPMNAELTTEVFQYLQAQKTWYLG